MLKEVIIFPTDTVYGIGASINDFESINKIYEIKGREFNKPIAVLTASIEDLSDYVIITEEFKTLAKELWPGAITFILKTTDKYYNLTKEETLGVRMPNHQKALEILTKYGPLKTTSVNKSSEQPLNNYLEIKEIYGKVVNKIYPNEEKISEVSSTVIDLTNDLKILRHGEITMDIIENILKRKGESL